MVDTARFREISEIAARFREFPPLAEFATRASAVAETANRIAKSFESLDLTTATALLPDVEPRVRRQGCIDVTYL